jgi:LAGLIDADG-like domain
MTNKWTIEEDNFLRAHLDQNNFLLSEKLGRTIYSIQHRCQKLGINKIYNQLKHEDKSTFFSDKELGYCLGIFASDGCLAIKKNENGSVVKRFDLTLGMKDVDFLLSIFKLLTGENINYRIKKPSLGKLNKVSYSCTLKNFIKSAEDFGITRNKSKTLNVNLENKSEDFKYYFLRGVIDGDGHVPIKYGKVSVVSASLKFIQTLDRHFDGSFRKRRRGDYWDFSLDYGEEYNLPKENYMLQRKTQRIFKRLDRRTKLL